MSAAAAVERTKPPNSNRQVPRLMPLACRLLQRLVRQPEPNLVEQKIVDGPSGHGMPRVRGQKGLMRLS
jgi:hypothetical protein